MNDSAESSSSSPPPPSESDGGAAAHKCALCGRRFAKAVNYRLHVRRMHSKSHKCPSCESCFDTQHELRKHASVEHPKLHKCVMCDYTNKLKYQVKRHEGQAHGEHSVSCSYADCSLLMPYRNLRRHIREEHSTATQPSTIVRLYSNRGGARGESAPSSTVTRHELATLNEEVARRGEAEKHSRVILKAQRNFEQKMGANPKNFKALTSVVTNATFNCELCHAQRDTRDALRRHIARVHEKRYVERKRPRRYTCREPNCGRSFRCPALLDDHLHIHKSEHPFECLRCDKKFSTKAEYSRHLRRYHGTSIHTLRHPRPLVELEDDDDDGGSDGDVGEDEEK